MPSRRHPLLVTLVTFVFLAGCARSPKGPPRVDGRNFTAFYFWRSSVSSQFTPDGWREFNNAIQEIRFGVMAHGVTGQAAIDQAMCDQVNGHTIPEVLQMGDNARLDRLIPLRNKLKLILDANGLLAPRPGESTDFIDRRIEDQRQRLAAVNADIEATNRRLVAHGGQPRDTNRVDPTPTMLSREQALAEFDRMIQGRLDYAAEKYGDWPARIDRKGSDLHGAQRKEFEEKRSAAAYNGHMVIPVYIRTSWRIYDDVVQYPEFSDAVVGNLSPRDMLDVRRKWADSEAEVWARKQASRESVDTAVGRIKSDLRAVMRP